MEKFPASVNIKLPEVILKPDLVYPVALPTLTQELQLYVNENEIKKHRKDFIEFWSLHLLQLTNGRSSSTDYDAYALSIVQKYECLKDRRENDQVSYNYSDYSEFVAEEC